MAQILAARTDVVGPRPRRSMRP